MFGRILTGLSIRVVFMLVCAFSIMPARATVSYTLMEPDASLIGALEKVHAENKDTLPDIARANGLGYQEIKLANPGVDTWLPGQGTEVVLPTLFVLPVVPHVGIVLNIPETPYMYTRIIQKKTRPSWHPPESIRKEHAEQGDPLPKRVPPGPNNPLGNYAMRLGMPEYIIHGTNKPFGIGMRVSHGCIRLYPEDIKSLYQQVELRTPVRIVNQPYKVGRYNDKIYLEAHPFMEEDAQQFEGNLTSVVEMLIKITGDMRYQVDWGLAHSVIAESNGIPVEIGRLIRTEQQDGVEKPEF